MTLPGIYGVRPLGSTKVTHHLLTGTTAYAIVRNLVGSYGSVDHLKTVAAKHGMTVRKLNSPS
jgi:hypothetical protein